jgi:hypothetical protein
VTEFRRVKPPARARLFGNERQAERNRCKKAAHRVLWPPGRLHDGTDGSTPWLLNQCRTASCLVPERGKLTGALSVSAFWLAVGFLLASFMVPAGLLRDLLDILESFRL